MKKIELLFLALFVTMSFSYVNHVPELGTSSLSLSVKDLNSSFQFYQKLGFEIIPQGGSIDQNWVILSNGKMKIGLFQGMFPKNTLTFNPEDARAIHQHLINHNINIDFQANIDKDSGPCSFMITDPDGNPILFDQH